MVMEHRRLRRGDRVAGFPLADGLLDLPVDVILAVALGALAVGLEHALDGLRRRAHEDGGDHADDDERHDPAEDDDGELAAVDRVRAVEEADGDRRADLAMRRRQRPALRRAVDDDKGRAELDAVAARRRHGDQLHTDGLHDLVAVRGKPNRHAEAAEQENPLGVAVRCHGLLVDEAVLPGEINSGERAHGVGHIVGTVRERVDHGREDLDVLKDLLRLRVEVLGV
mmetsp:Transcript_19136/g.65737  ORF Transcript_19136/g.65737 Transcript_19136/m.65737 type:complete len:226 (+) Transcript_19136:168-845(+)